MRITPSVVGHINGAVSAPDSRDLDGTRVELFAPGVDDTGGVTLRVQDGLEDETLTAGSIGELNRSTFNYYGEAPPGTYCVKVTPSVGSGLAARAYASAPDCTSGFTPVVVNATEYTTDVDITLEPRKPGDPGHPGDPGDPDDPNAVYVPLSEPRRLTDTRSSGATVDGVDAGTGRVEGGSTHEVLVAGRAGVPAGAASVVLNVTAVDAKAAGFVTVWPCGVEQPLASNVNFEAGETRPNSVIAKVGADGKVCVFASQTTDAVVDVAGYFPAADGFTPLTAPGRLTDTRASMPRSTVSTRLGRVEGGSTHEVVVAGRAGVPAGAASVVLNVTAVDATAAGFVTVWPCGVDRPLASNVNFEAGETRPNSVIAKIGAAGKVCVFASQTIDTVVDVAGYFPAADGFTPLTAPGRLTDTRIDGGTADGVDAASGRLEGGQVHEVIVAGRAGVPAGATTAVLNVTAVDAEAAGFVTVWPCGVDRPLASNVNFEGGETRPNSVIAKIGAAGKVCVFASQTIDAVVDVAGYFAN